MSSSRLAKRLSCLLSLVCLPMAAGAQSPAQWRTQQLDASLKSERIMKQADTRKGLLAQYQVMRYAYAEDKSPAFRLIFGQYMSWYQTFIGDYPDAALSFSIRQPSESDDRPSPVANGDYTAQPALDAIPELAKNYQLVFLNEAHNIPLTRTLTVQLLPGTAQGWIHLSRRRNALSDGHRVQTRGYPIAKSGFYTEEPISAELVRTALKLGFKLIPYEATSDATGDAREAEQARNIYAAVFKKDPKARLIVEAGYAHIQKSGEFLGGQSMAEHLYKLSGIDGLSVEQTMMIPHPSSDDDHPYYASIVKKFQPAAPIVFVDKTEKPWSLRPGYNVSVIFPPQRLRRGRPTWLTLGNLRQPVFVSGDKCDEQYPCLIEARYSAEGKDAIAADRMVLDPLPLMPTMGERIRQGSGAPVGELYLRPGEYELNAIGTDDQTLFSQHITVSDSVPTPPQ
jgi:hypothetical protein